MRLAIFQGKLKSVFILFLLTLNLQAQSGLKGWLVDEQKMPLEGATLTWKSLSAHAVSDSAGYFQLNRLKSDSILVINYVGFKTLEYKLPAGQNEVRITLSENIVLQQVEVRAKANDSFTPLSSNMNKEVISMRELRKAPCCNLSESFETSAVVDANYTNAALGTREIEMLGIRGIYSQIMLDSRPTLYNFAAPFAFDFIPGPWLKGVQVSKGAGTVANGAEGLAGQINVDLVDPRDGPKLFVNAYANHRSRYEMNIVTNKRLGEKWSMGTLLHANQDQHHQDKNEDAFLDAPQKKQINVMQRFHYYGLKWETQFNVHGIWDKREGGQTRHPSPDHQEELLHYDHEQKRLEIFGHVGFVGFKDPGRSIGFQWHLQGHDYDAAYARLANGSDRSAYANLLYQEKFGSVKHSLLSGLSMRRSVTDEGFSDFIFNRKEFIPGMFSEYSYNADVPESIFGFTLGMRLDKYGEYGVHATPRFSMRYQVEEYGTLRASAGRAYRMPNIISDNLHFIGMGRYFQVPSVGLDIANNYGLSYIQKIYLGGPTEWNISADFYHTVFKKQNIQDIESETSYVINRYVDKGSRINYLLFQNQFQMNANFGFKLAYKYTDARYRQNDDQDLISRLYLPKHRALFTLDLNSNESVWLGNITVQWVGSQRLLDISNYPTPGSAGRPDHSPSYMLVNFHISRNIGKWELYTGMENATNYVQEYQIVSPTSTGSRYFDATRLYAPNMGMRWYGGVKWLLN